MFKINPRIEGSDHELRTIYQDIDTSVIGHFTDFGHVRNVHHMGNQATHIVGNAITVRIPHCDGSILREALILSQPDDILVIDTSGDYQRACWGELRTLAAMIKNLAGVVIDGAVTDIDSIKTLGFPVFARTISPLTTRSLKLEGEINSVISVGGVCVQAGDLVIADSNGVFILEPTRAKDLASTFKEKKQKDQQRFLELYTRYKQTR
ncbi:RraA family protein [Acinetobacter sp. ESBL14]|uniref:RraA family protein n=1 Tax=Acinetobacter sp. ESBL14 TaxID=3077329 RepID=UPI002FC838FD